MPQTTSRAIPRSRRAAAAIPICLNHSYNERDFHASINEHDRAMSNIYTIIVSYRKYASARMDKHFAECARSPKNKIVGSAWPSTRRRFSRSVEISHEIIGQRNLSTSRLLTLHDWQTFKYRVNCVLYSLIECVATRRPLDSKSVFAPRPWHFGNGWKIRRKRRQLHFDAARATRRKLIVQDQKKFF